MENENELLTRKVFLDGMAGLEHFIKIDVREVVHGEIEKLALMTQKGFEGVARDIEALDVRLTKFEKYVENRFDAIAQELKDVRKAMAQADTRADVVDLQLRVSKLEKKVHFKG